MMRVAIRDILIPISETPFLYDQFNSSHTFHYTLKWQELFFDIFDFGIALVTLYMFQQSAEMNNQ